MSAVVSSGACQGCGAELPPERGSGRPRKWCSDRCRKSQYAGVCESCGGPTDGTTPSRGVPRICGECLRWDEPSIIDAIRRWADEHGGIPPTLTEWQSAGSDHPAGTTVRDLIGWNEALLRAGFGLKCDRRAQTQERIESQIRAGVPTREIADALGVTPDNIHMRMRTRGTTVGALRNGRSS